MLNKNSLNPSTLQFNASPFVQIRSEGAKINHSPFRHPLLIADHDHLDHDRPSLLQSQSRSFRIFYARPFFYFLSPPTLRS